MSRLRRRLAATSSTDRALRVMLILAHEAVRERDRALQVSAGLESDSEGASVAAIARTEDYGELVKHVRAIVADTVPAGANILVVSRGDGDLLVPGYEAAHFPQGRDGAYAGFYPRDSDAAIAHLEHLSEAGAEFLVLPAPAHWWLDYYGELARHLLTTGRVTHHDDHCLIFHLGAHWGGDV